MVRSINTTIAKNHVIGNPETEARGIVVGDDSRNTKVVNNVVRNIPEGDQRDRGRGSHQYHYRGE